MTPPTFLSAFVHPYRKSLAKTPGTHCDLSTCGQVLTSSSLDWAISVIGVIVFVGLTAYDTQRIKEMYDVNDDGTISGRKGVMGALRLYLHVINLFLMLLRIFGNGR
jgi:uncharacterized protein